MIGQTIVFALGDGADNGAASVALANYVKAQDPDRFFYLGDVYETGTASEFATKYEPRYGAIASKTDPVIGNHEYPNRATGYFPYWQSKRGWTEEEAKHRAYVDPGSGWQIIAYSSETDMAAEGAWVGKEIARYTGTCRIVMAHKGRHVVADTAHSDNSGQEPVWSKIIAKTAINLVGHNHIYGRLAPISGVHVFVSGAGGHGLRSLGVQHHTVANSKTGVATATRFVLRPARPTSARSTRTERSMTRARSAARRGSPRPAADDVPLGENQVVVVGCSSARPCAIAERPTAIAARNVTAACVATKTLVSACQRYCIASHLHLLAVWWTCQDVLDGS